MAGVLGKWNFKQPPTGAFKWALRLPTLAFRLRLGWMFGERLILLTHRGRRSGRLYQTPLEVLEHDRSTREYIVCSGLGATSDWYRNLRAEPAVAVQVGRAHWIPEMRFLEPEEAAQRLLMSERHRPALTRLLLRSMGRSYDGTNTDRLRMVADMPMIAFSDSARTKNPWAARHHDDSRPHDSWAVR